MSSERSVLHLGEEGYQNGEGDLEKLETEEVSSRDGSILWGFRDDVMAQSTQVDTAPVACARPCAKTI